MRPDRSKQCSLSAVPYAPFKFFCKRTFLPIFNVMLMQKVVAYKDWMKNFLMLAFADLISPGFAVYVVIIISAF